MHLNSILSNQFSIYLSDIHLTLHGCIVISENGNENLITENRVLYGQMIIMVFCAQNVRNTTFMQPNFHLTFKKNEVNIVILKEMFIVN